ncbi:MAG: superoxide dismutase [Verrucomicrobiaceae bacterium]|nr:MAG: superoxide dismutase [Verrucomicrobiaceae bacterium]
MITRRTALKTLVLSSGAVALSPSYLTAQQLGTAPTEAEGVFKLPPLGYDYDALEPFIDAETMKLHHDKHHAAYVSKLNQVLAKAPGIDKQSIEEILSNLESVPEEIRNEVRNQGGGHANHTLFWATLKKNEKGIPTGEVATGLNTDFGSFERFQELWRESASKVFGSGWTWLVWRGGKLAIENTTDRDSPLISGATPLLGLDVWEHAYYLKYQNRRADYIAAFENVINWEAVNDLFLQARNG